MPTHASESPLPPPARDSDAGMHWPCLLTALAIMIGITLYPPLLADAQGKAEHGLASVLFLAMSAGFVRGVGFVPHLRIWRGLFSPVCCALALVLALLLKLGG